MFLLIDVRNLVFALTGISLNHRELFESAPDSYHYQLPLNVIAAESIKHQLNTVEISLSSEQLGQLVTDKEFSVSSPGKRLDIYIEGDFLEIERVNLGLVSQRNELHQNRYTSKLWRLVSDFSAVVFIIIAGTGVWLSLRDRRQRKNYLTFLILSFLSFIYLME